MNDMNDRKRIALAFKELRKRGWFARMSFWCCQSCGCSAVPEKYKDKFVFFHKQDADSINEDGNILPTSHYRRGSDCMYMTHGEGGDANEIVAMLNKYGLDATWNGNNNTRIMVKHRA